MDIATTRKNRPKGLFFDNPAYGSHWISRPMRIVAPPPRSFKSFFFVEVVKTMILQPGVALLVADFLFKLFYLTPYLEKICMKNSNKAKISKSEKTKPPKRCNSAFLMYLCSYRSDFLLKKLNWKLSVFPPIPKWIALAAGYFLLTSLQSITLSQTMWVTSLLRGGPYSMECQEVLSSVAGCFTLPLS